MNSKASDKKRTMRSDAVGDVVGDKGLPEPVRTLWELLEHDVGVHIFPFIGKGCSCHDTHTQGCGVVQGDMGCCCHDIERRHDVRGWFKAPGHLRSSLSQSRAVRNLLFLSLKKERPFTIVLRRWAAIKCIGQGHRDPSRRKTWTWMRGLAFGGPPPAVCLLLHTALRAVSGRDAPRTTDAHRLQTAATRVCRGCGTPTRSNPDREAKIGAPGRSCAFLSERQRVE